MADVNGLPALKVQHTLGVDQHTPVTPGMDQHTLALPVKGQMQAICSNPLCVEESVLLRVKLHVYNSVKFCVKLDFTVMHGAATTLPFCCLALLSQQ